MERQYISVFALNKYIKAKMNQDVSLQNVYIKGEISNYRPHPSGHLYFTLKDENSRASAIMFASAARKMSFQIENGMQVFIHASVSVYEASGQYQLYVQTIQQDGIGNLYLQYEALKSISNLFVLSLKELQFCQLSKVLLYKILFEQYIYDFLLQKSLFFQYLFRVKMLIYRLLKL